MAVEAQGSGAQPAAQLVEQIAGLLARQPEVEGIDLDTAYYAKVDPAGRGAAGRTLLPADYSWSATRSTGARVPLQLCEYLAYRTALAYEPERRIRAYLENCCEGITAQSSRFKFFDSTREGASKAGILADAQGFGYVFERKAFLIFRGTQSGNDWKINRADALTDNLGGQSDRRYRKLEQDYGELLSKLGNPSPGRHVGFSIAWAALKDEVEAWLASALEDGAIDQIVYSGHSLGGAMAQIAAFDHARIESALEQQRGIAPSHIAAVVTFGAPAVGGDKFVEVYRDLLGTRTVLMESSGDLVPRIMNRWYYRMLYPLRQRVKAGVQLHLQATEGFGKVSTPWSFKHEPPLSDNDIDAALSSLRAAGEKALKELAEKQKKQAKPDAKQTANTGGTQQASSGTGSHDGGTTKPADAKNGGPDGTTNADGEKPAGPSEPAPTWVYWVVVGVVVLAAAGVAWYFVRRKLFSHDIEQRYALYLSTLSYQQLRAKHGGNLELANKELEEHLRFIRGDVAKPIYDDFGKAVALHEYILSADGKPTPIFQSVRTLPVQIKLRQDPLFLEYLNKPETFV